MMPKVRLDVLQQNYQATRTLNDMSKILFNRCDPDKSGIVIPGSVSMTKSKLKIHMLECQKSEYITTGNSIKVTFSSEF